jgi:hypothetical protein
MCFNDQISRMDADRFCSKYQIFKCVFWTERDYKWSPTLDRSAWGERSRHPMRPHISCCTSSCVASEWYWSGMSDERARCQTDTIELCRIERIELTYFTFVWPCIVTNFFVIKPVRCTNFSNLFWNETLHVSDISSVHHQELFTVHSAMIYVIQVCRQLSSSSRIRMELQFHHDPAAAAARKLSTNLYDIYHRWGYSE